MSQPITLTLAQRAPRPLRWLGILLVLGLLCMPFLALLPASHPLAVPSWLLTLSGKILCYAIVAVALDLVWGYAGMLSLGHGIFFALGGYAMGMYLMRQAAGDGLPAFMSFLSWSELPWFWWGTQHFAWAMALVVLVPGLLALVFGWLCLSLEDQRGLFLDHDPGPDLCRYAAVLSQRDRVWRQQRLHRFYYAAGFSGHRHRHPRQPVYGHGFAAVADAVAGRGAGAE